MGLGATALITNPKKEIAGPPSPPFDPSSANNGLSVDPVSGAIVLGNDFGNVSAPAQLLSFREIQMDDGAANSYGIFLNSLVNAAITFLSGYSLEILGQDGTTPSIAVGAGNGSNAEIEIQTGTGSAADIVVQAASGRAALAIACDNDSLELLVDGSGQILFGVSNFGIPITMMSFDTGAFTMQLGATQVAPNGANVQIAGTLNRRYLNLSRGAGLYLVDRDTDSDRVLFNTAAATFELPNMVGSNDRPGFIFRALVQNAAGVTVQAGAGQVIRFGTLASSSGGTVASVSVGSCVTLIWNGVGGWVAESFTGVWNFT